MYFLIENDRIKSYPHRQNIDSRKNKGTEYSGYKKLRIVSSIGHFHSPINKWQFEEHNYLKQNNS